VSCEDRHQGVVLETYHVNADGKVKILGRGGRLPLSFQLRQKFDYDFQI